MHAILQVELEAKTPFRNFCSFPSHLHSSIPSPCRYRIHNTENEVVFDMHNLPYSSHLQPWWPHQPPLSPRPSPPVPLRTNSHKAFLVHPTSLFHYLLQAVPHAFAFQIVPEAVSCVADKFLTQHDRAPRVRACHVDSLENDSAQLLAQLT
jgi:hypothetical protein